LPELIVEYFVKVLLTVWTA